MADANTPVHRATLIMGYGDFGLDVLRRFLDSTATRGVLTWEQSSNDDQNARRLRDLALLWVHPHLSDTAQADRRRVQEDSHAELMRDLYQQIEQVEVDDDQSILAKIMEEKAKLLLDAATRAMRRENLPLGLDVIVIAQPRDRAALGRLTPLLQAGIERLNRYATQLQRQVSGTGALNFIQILDFENYWYMSEQSKALRTAVYNAIKRWQQQRGEGKPGFGRIYLVDGQDPRGGMRSERMRIDEISLFLEFLLFEGQRGELQAFYQPKTPQEPLLATFGIRLLERSGGLLRRLAAARFGMDWLDYLADGGIRQGEAGTLELRKQLGAYRVEALNPLWEAMTLPVDINRQLESIAQELARIPIDGTDWSGQVESRYSQAARQMENEWAAHAHQQIRQILDREPLVDLAKNLRDGIDAALHSRQPATLGAVVREVDAVLSGLTSEPTPDITANQKLPNDGGCALLRQDYQRYQHFKRGQINPHDLGKWWPLFSLLLGLGLTPMWVEALSFPPPDPLTAPFLWQRLYPLLQWLAGHPTILLTLFTAILWGLLANVAQQGIVGRLQRGRRFWNDPKRGRLVGRLHSLLRPDGELGRHLDGFLQRMRQDMALSIRSDVGRELSRVLKRLSERQREVAWLRGQLREFLVMHGINPDVPNEKWTRMDHERTGIRHTLEQYKDYENILDSIPRLDGPFSSMQTLRKPFKQWDERYCDAFLYPLRFIDELSEQYKDPFEGELAKPDIGIEQNARARELRDLLERHGNFSTAFSWRAQEGVPVDQVYCLLPQIWLGLQGVPSTLTGLGITESHHFVGVDASRAYLVRVKIGVNTQCLLD